MRTYLCPNCGNRERDNINPSPCPVCRHAMEPAPLPTSAVSDGATIIRLWQDGQPLTGKQQRILDDFMAANRAIQVARLARYA